MQADITKDKPTYNGCVIVIMQLTQLIEGGFALAAATNNGQSCSPAVSEIFRRENQGQVSFNQ